MNIPIEELIVQFDLKGLGSVVHLLEHQTVWRSLGAHWLILIAKLFYQEDAWKLLVLDHGANDAPPSSLSPEGRS